MDRNVYLLFTQTNSLLSRMIKVYTRAEFNHISICLDDDLGSFFSFGRKKPWVPFFAGFVTETIAQGVYQVFKETNCCICRLEVGTDSYLRLRNMIDLYIANQQYYSYNLAGLIGIVFKIPITRKNSYFCSQFIASLLQESDIHDFGKDYSLVAPWELMRIPGLTVVYRGKMRYLKRILDGVEGRLA